MTGSQALIFFYAVFWGATVAGVGRYRAFDTHRFTERDNNGARKPLRRFLVGFTLLNLGPALSIAVLNEYGVPQDAEGIFTVTWASVVALSVFGFVRLLHAAIAVDERRRVFYSVEEWNEVKEKLVRGNNRTVNHLVPGLVYVLVLPTLSVVARTVLL